MVQRCMYGSVSIPPHTLPVWEWALMARRYALVLSVCHQLDGAFWSQNSVEIAVVNDHQSLSIISVFSIRCRWGFLQVYCSCNGFFLHINWRCKAYLLFGMFSLRLHHQELMECNCHGRNVKRSENSHASSKWRIQLNGYAKIAHLRSSISRGQVAHKFNYFSNLACNVHSDDTDKRLVGLLTI